MGRVDEIVQNLAKRYKDCELSVEFNDNFGYIDGYEEMSNIAKTAINALHFQLREEED